MGAEGAAEIVFRKEIDAAEDQAARRKELVDAVPRDVLESVCGGGTAAGGRHYRAGGDAQSTWRGHWNRCTASASCGRRRSMD